jgi:deferrochelatase/peroxidase EfeB
MPHLAAASRDVNARELTQRVPFDAFHQSGIITPKAAQATIVALDSVAPNTTALFEGLQAISSEARQLAQGEPVGVAEIDDPPPDSGILGAYNTPDSLTVTIGYGASPFDDRYGLAAKRPPRLTAMPSFALDELDPTRTGGDVVIQVCAGQRDTVVHTVRELMRAVAGHLTIRWMLDGFQTAVRDRNPKANTRNLFAFRDGTANPDVTDADLMNELVWVKAAPGEPAWTTGGTYMVVRTIRQHVEFWDRVGMVEQKQMIGRDRVTGAPLGGTDEFEDPRYDLDPKGDRIPLDAHIRMANLLPVGGGYFFAPPGSRGGGDWMGSGMSVWGGDAGPSTSCWARPPVARVASVCGVRRLAGRGVEEQPGLPSRAPGEHVGQRAGFGIGRAASDALTPEPVVLDEP